jgi:imidazolonepropionase-like amidohydrolase
MHRAGVPFLAGTDTAPGVYIMPGFSLHDELANFVEAGFAPMESLQTATSNAAKFLGMEGNYGSVEAGKIADLVLLGANPLDDIHNTKKIRAVIVNGRFFDRAALDRILRQVEFAAKGKAAQARANSKTAATSTFSSRTGTMANTLGRRP